MSNGKAAQLLPCLHPCSHHATLTEWIQHDSCWGRNTKRPLHDPSDETTKITLTRTRLHSVLFHVLGILECRSAIVLPKHPSLPQQ